MEDVKPAKEMNGLPPDEKTNDYVEYEAEMDTSDEEVGLYYLAIYCLDFELIFDDMYIIFKDIRNTVGNIPMNWYDEYPHVGYDWDGKKIIKPERGDQLDNFMEKMENPDFW